MSEFRFSPNSNRANEIRWRPWTGASFAEAAEKDRPVLLNLSAVWCQWCRQMDETTFSDPAVIDLVNEALTAIRVDTDRYPHVQDRYIAGGWPTNAFLTPTGEVLWAGTYTTPQEFRDVAERVLAAWRDRRTDLVSEIERRRLAANAGRGRPTLGMGLVRREAADDVLTATRSAFDARNGGFGDAPKFPHPDAVELLFLQAAQDPACAAMADQTLDGMLAGELWDAVDGGFFRYATAADWTAPRYEKLLELNAVMLDTYAHAAWLRGRDDWRAIAERTVAWVDAVLALPEHVWAGSQCADVDYFTAPAADRGRLAPPPIDPTVYATANAAWIAALALAGARLERPDWIARAELAMHRLSSLLRAPDGGVHHYHDGATAHIHFLAADTLATARAALALAQATGAATWIDEARRLARHLEEQFWADDGGFRDRRSSDHDVGALRYPDRPFELNAEAARLLLDLAHLTGERRWRALAERTLARLCPLAGRYGVAAAACALAIHEFFEAPPRVFITLGGQAAQQSDATELRAAAFALRVPGLRVWTVPSGHAIGPQQFTAEERPIAYVWTRRGCSRPIMLAERLVDAL